MSPSGIRDEDPHPPHPTPPPHATALSCSLVGLDTQSPGCHERRGCRGPDAPLAKPLSQRFRGRGGGGRGGVVFAMATAHSLREPPLPRWDTTVFSTLRKVGVGDPQSRATLVVGCGFLVCALSPGWSVRASQGASQPNPWTPNTSAGVPPRPQGWHPRNPLGRRRHLRNNCEKRYLLRVLPPTPQARPLTHAKLEGTSPPADRGTRP